AESLERVEALVKILDTQTPQVLIEAKVVEVNEGFAKNIGGSLGIASTSTAATQALSSINGANPLASLIGGVFKPDEGGGGNVSGGAGLFALSPNVTFLPGMERLNAQLLLGESENMVRVLSSPRLVVMNNQNAVIVQSTPTFNRVVTSDEGVTQSSIEILQAELSMNVTPTVTNDEQVLLQL